jgi:predicted alpha/beta-hydrolase family hydrolase
MRHQFMDTISARLAERRIATFRYQFPYSEASRRRPDPAPILMTTVRSAVIRAAQSAPDLSLLAGGKSMGGRMTSMMAAREPLPEVQGLVFFGFPLHAAGRPASDRGEHLSSVNVPMLFLQGDRDRLADLSLLRPLVRELGDRAHLHVEKAADHSFKVPMRSGKKHDQVLTNLADEVSSWSATL